MPKSGSVRLLAGRMGDGWIAVTCLVARVARVTILDVGVGGGGRRCHLGYPVVREERLGTPTPRHHARIPRLQHLATCMRAQMWNTSQGLPQPALVTTRGAPLCYTPNTSTLPPTHLDLAPAVDDDFLRLEGNGLEPFFKLFPQVHFGLPLDFHRLDCPPSEKRKKKLWGGGGIIGKGNP